MLVLSWNRHYDIEWPKLSSIPTKSWNRCIKYKNDHKIDSVFSTLLKRTQEHKEQTITLKDRFTLHYQLRNYNMPQHILEGCVSFPNSLRKSHKILCTLYIENLCINMLGRYLSIVALRKTQPD